MDCPTCNELLAAYKHSVNRFKNAVQNLPGAGEDSRLAIEQADSLKLMCREANDALMEHLREHHGGVAAESAT
jgi:hypothetical protein